MKRMSRSLRNAGAIFLSIAISSAAPAATSMQAASLLAVDQNRPEIIDGLVARWKGYLAAGKEVELKRTLTTLRADKLLALALAQDEKSFAALLEKDSFLPVNGAQRVTQAKELGDASRDVVYRPINPCRIFDTRPANPLIAGVARSFNTQGALAAQGGNAAGCGIAAGATALVMQLTNEFPAGSGFIIGGAEGTAGGGIMVYAANSQITVSATLPLNTTNGRFALLANNANTQLIGDAVGYFMPVTSGNIIGTFDGESLFAVTNNSTAPSSAAIGGFSTSTTNNGFGIFGSQSGTGVGVGGQTTGAGLGVYGVSNNGYGVYGNAGDGTTVGYGVFSDGRLGVAPDSVLDFGSQTREMIRLWGGAGNYAIGVQGSTQYFRVDAPLVGGGFAWYRGGVHSDTTFDPGAGGATLMTLSRTGVLSAQSFGSLSDINAKTGFAAIDAKAILAKVASLPIMSWTYNNEMREGVRHVGPVAQDFKRAFNLGYDDKVIATVDADGVALAAIQGLNQLLNEERATNRKKDARINKLERELEVIKKKLGL